MREDTVVLICSVIAVVLILTGAFFADRYVCLKKYENIVNARYKLVLGCQVEVKTKWIPSENYVTNE